MPNIIVANWKENGTVSQAKEWIDALKQEQSLLYNIQLIACPPFTILSEVYDLAEKAKLPIKIGAQDVSPFEKGSHTGDVSSEMLKDIGVSHVIIGHSERRNAYNETDLVIVEKIKRAMENAVIPIHCASTIDQVSFLKSHIAHFDGLILLEDPNAISTGQPDSLENKNQPLNPQDANALAGKMKELFPQVQLIYGGSVDRNNVVDFLKQNNFVGVIVGARSLNSPFFLDIIKAISGYAK